MSSVKVTPASVWTVKNFNSSEVEQNSTLMDDKYDAISEGYAKSGTIKNGEFRTITLHTNGSDPTLNSPCGTLLKVKNDNGVIRTLIDNREPISLPYEKIKKFNTLNWGALSHRSGAYYNDQQSWLAYTINRTTTQVKNGLAVLNPNRMGLIQNSVVNTSSPGWPHLFGDPGDAATFNSTDFNTCFADIGGPKTADAITTFFEDVAATYPVMHFIAFDIENITEEALPDTINDSSDHVDALDNDSRYDAIKTEIGESDLQWMKTEGGTTIRMNNLRGVLRRHVYSEIQKYILKPMLKIWPMAKAAQYTLAIQTNDTLPQMWPNTNNLQLRCDMFLGDYQNPSFYGSMASVSNFPPAYIGSPFPADGFNCVIYAVNQWRVHKRVFPSAPLMPWVTRRSRTDNTIIWNSYHKYWDEHIRHMALYDVSTFAFFNQFGDAQDAASADEAMETILTELNDMIGFDQVIPITVAEHDWHPDFIVSGGRIQDANKSLWRVTVPIGVDEVTIDGTTYDIDQNVACGVWHESDVNTTNITVS